MKFCKLFVVAIFAAAAITGSANAQLTLVTNGDFSAGGADWGEASVGAAFSYPATGGNTGGHGQIDQTAAGWGGVMINDNDTAVSLGSLGLTAGDSVTFSIDMIDLAGNGADAGMKIENWGGGGTPALIDDSGDIVFDITTSWDTYTFDFTVDAGADSIKFVPLMVGQATGSSVGFDNVGFVSAVPEPASAGLIALGLFGLVARRRRS